MTDLTAPPPPDYVTHTALEKLLREVLADVVSEGALVKMVNAAVDSRVNTAVDLRVENMRTLISAIDSANRTNFQDFKNISGEFKTTAASIQTAMSVITERMARTETGQEADRKRISDVFNRVDGQEKQIDELRQQLSRIETQQHELRTDIHGDPTQAMRPSIHSMLGDMDKKLDTKFGGIEASIGEIKSIQERHEQYITRRQAVEKWVLDVGKGIWKNKVSRVALLASLPVLGTLILSSVSPAFSDFITRLLMALLAGK